MLFSIGLTHTYFYLCAANKSQLPQMDQHDMLCLAYCLIYEGGCSV